MFSSAFEAELKLCYEGGLLITSQLKVLRALVKAAKNIDLEKINLDFAAAYIHQLFTIRNQQMTTLLLRLCYELENKSKTYITEKYSFDKLIVISFDYLYIQVYNHTQELEEIIFSYINLIIEKRKYLPKSIINAFVSANLSSVYQFTNKEIHSIIRGVCKCPFIADVVEISSLITKFLVKTQDYGIYDYIPEALESEDFLVSTPNFISELIAPLARTDMQETDESAKNVVPVLGRVLSSWPGLISFGINQKILFDLLRCLPHKPQHVLSVLRKLLFVKNDSVLSDAFVALTLYYLLQIGLLDVLNENAPINKETAAFLNDLMPLLTGTYTQQLELSALSSIHAPEPNIQCNASLVFKLAQSYSINQKVYAISNVTLSSDPYLWEWHTIYKLLFVVLPYNEQECQSKAAISFYEKLLECFASSFLAEKTDKAAAMEESLDALFHLFLMNPNLWVIIENSVPFKNAIEQTRTNISKTQPDVKAPCWSLFKFMCQMMSEEVTCKILKKWGTYEKLLLIATNITNINCVRLILSYLIFTSEPQFAIKTYSIFLDSNDTDIVEVTVKSLRSHINEPKFAENIFRTTIIPKIKRSRECMLLLNLFVDCIVHDSWCLSIGRADKELHEIIKNKARLAYFLLLEQDSYNDEIRWWVEEGNRQYVEPFGTICSCAFEDKISLDKIEKCPTLLFPRPPNLFDKLSNNERTAALLEPFIPAVVDALSDKDEMNRRGACIALGFYGSSRFTQKIVNAFNIPRRLITADLSGFAATGDLIAALSMFHSSELTSKVFQENGWHVFNFSTKKCILPPLEKLKREVKRYSCKCEQIKDIEEYKEVTDLFKEITNPSKKEKESIKEKLKELEKSNPPKLLNADLASYAMNIISAYSYKRSDRLFIMSIFKHTPLIEKPSDAIDEAALSYAKAVVYEITKLQNEAACTKLPALSANSCKDAPECYLNDEEFQKVAGMSKKEFYELDSTEMSKIREQIIQTVQ